MYKLLIVDDESIIRDGIINNMDFVSMGIEVVGSCENGVEALEVFREKSPDIVLTDINMPFMDGIELSETLLELDPLVKVVVLTGYDRFEYAQQALKLKISDYLVKPVLPRDLKPVFAKVIRQIEEERTQEESMTRLREQLSETMPIMRERFLNSLVFRDYSTSELQGKLNSYELSMNARCYQALCMDFHHYKKDAGDFNFVDEVLMKLLRIARIQLNDLQDCLVFRSYFDQIVIIAGGDYEDDVREVSHLLAEKIEEIARINHDLIVGIGLGKAVRRLETISRSFKEAKEALEYEAFRGHCRIVSAYDLGSGRGEAMDLASYAGDIYKEFRSGTTETIKEVLKTFFENISEGMLSIDRYYIHIQNVVMSIMLSLQDQGIECNKIFGGSNPTIDLYNYESLEAIESWLYDLCEKIMAYIALDREDYQTSQGKKAVAYIEAHYQEQDLSLKVVCQALSMSVSYFSSLFKENTGKTFVDYLTTLRMDKAKELLRNTDKKTYEIAELVGYKDAHYFSLVFKKNVGQTATAFRESAR